MVVFANDIYMDLCIRYKSLTNLSINACESGVYLALMIVEFYRINEDKFRHDMQAFDTAWCDFLLKAFDYPSLHAREKQEVPRIYSLIREIYIFQPALPRPTGFLKFINRPRFYTYKPLLLSEHLLNRTSSFSIQGHNDCMEELTIYKLKTIDLSENDFALLPNTVLLRP